MRRLLLFALLLAPEAGAACVLHYQPGSAAPIARYWACATFSEAPNGVNSGDLAWATDTATFYVWSGGAWQSTAGSGGGAPTDAQYWTGAAHADLSAEKNLGALATGLVVNTSGTPSAYAGSTCGAGTKATATSTAGGLTCSAVSLTADVSGSLPLANLADDSTSGLCLVSGGAGQDPNYTTCPGGGGGLSQAQVLARMSVTGAF